MNIPYFSAVKTTPLGNWTTAELMDALNGTITTQPSGGKPSVSDEDSYIRLGKGKSRKDDDALKQYAQFALDSFTLGTDYTLGTID